MTRANGHYEMKKKRCKGIYCCYRLRCVVMELKDETIPERLEEGEGETVSRYERREWGIDK